MPFVTFCWQRRIGQTHYISESLTPWLMDRFNVTAAQNVIAGLSLTGLSAAHTALVSRGVFNHVLSLSGSFWWNDAWLPGAVESLKSSELTFSLTVGRSETEEQTVHVHHGMQLEQNMSQIEANQKMRDALIRAGHRVLFREHAGGHDIMSWRSVIADSLAALFERR